MVRGDDGQPLFLLGVAFDITGMKQAEEVLKASLDDFAFVASHDLKEAVRSMSRFAAFLRQALSEQDETLAHKSSERILNGALLMDRLIDDLSVYAQVDREGTPRPTDWNKLFEQMRENLFEAITESKAEVTAGPLPTVNGVEIQLLRVLQNLVNNALKFRADRPIRVRVSAERLEDMWLFRVQDNGIGIEADDLKRLFKKIGQVGRLHPRSKYPGTGLGLGICKKIVESHGGRIWVESEWDHGSTFCFTLPVRDSLPPADSGRVP
jgi:chemotaxis family two-component system sensor kinase Cph1